MKKFKVINSETNPESSMELSFGLGVSWDHFKELLRSSLDIRNQKTWNKWCSDSFSRIVDFYQMREVLNMELMRRRIEYLNSKVPYMEVDSKSRIQFMNFAPKTLGTHDVINTVSALTNCSCRLIDVQSNSKNDTVDVYWLAPNFFSSYVYRHIMEGKDGRIYHRPYPVSTWIIVMRFRTEVFMKEISYMSYDKLIFDDYKEEVQKISFI